MFRHLVISLLAMAHVACSRYLMYLTGCVISKHLPPRKLYLGTSRQHNVVPEQNLVTDITHVALAFMNSEMFNQVEPHSWPLFTTVDSVRSKFSPGTAIMVAIGGWGDTEGFPNAAATVTSRKRFAQNVKAMIEYTGADGMPIELFPRSSLLIQSGVDIDWEYPGLVTFYVRGFPSATRI